MDRADTDPQRVQAPSRDDEAHAVKQRALAGRQFGSVRVPVEDGEEADQRRGNPKGGRTSNITAAPSRIAERAIPYSIPGSGTPISPSIPPKAITMGNATGRTQIAGEPSCAPHSPTATIAST